MPSQLSAGDFLEQPTSCGSVSEQHWLDLFSQYLPQRYAASPVFVVDADGRRSRQIDVAIYDRLYSPLLFPHSSGLHIPAESVYAVFEVKQILTARWIRDAGILAPYESLDLGCALRHGAFELPPDGRIQFSLPAESLIFLIIRLLERLRAMGTAPAADLMAYARSLQSFKPGNPGTVTNYPI
jgi:hypothetical protein